MRVAGGSVVATPLLLLLQEIICIARLVRPLLNFVAVGIAVHALSQRVGGWVWRPPIHGSLFLTVRLGITPQVATGACPGYACLTDVLTFRTRDNRDVGRNGRSLVWCSLGDGREGRGRSETHVTVPESTVLTERLHGACGTAAFTGPQ